MRLDQLNERPVLGSDINGLDDRNWVDPGEDRRRTVTAIAVPRESRVKRVFRTLFPARIGW